MDCYIVEAIRTPRGRGKKDGKLHCVTSLNLVTQLLHHLKHHQAAALAAEDLILGCVMPVGEQGANIARSAILAADYPQGVPGIQINRFCSSGLDAIALAASRIDSGQANLILAGGVESMSRVPMLSDGGAMMLDPQVAYTQQIVPQGISADLIATLAQFSRKELDEFALSSHQKACAAQKRNAIQSIIPIRNHLGEIILDRDENVRSDCNLEQLSILNPSFVSIGKMGGFSATCLQKYPEIEKLMHFHHAGNSSAISDGAALTLLANKQTLKEKKLTPKARILGYQTTGLDPTIMLTAPSVACQNLLQRLQIDINEIDIIEINEAFSSVVLYFMQNMGIDQTKVNLNGGAIALGHPLGATGAMILGTAVDLLQESNKRLALVSLCTAGGMGLAMVIENMKG